MNKQREDGFTLIELLVVVIIIGILASIAIPVFLNQRRKAWTAATKSDLHNAALEAENWFADQQTYAGLDASTLKHSDRDTLTFARQDTLGYCINADHANLPGPVDWHLDSDVGVIEAGAC